MEHIRLRRRLDHLPNVPAWPADIRLENFTSQHAQSLHALLKISYAKGGGSVVAFPEWWKALSTDSEYDPALCFTAFSSGTLVGAAQCWTSGYIKDLVVHPDWHRRGIATVLLLHAFHTFRLRGVNTVDLKVETGNPGAIALYRSLGMVSV